VGGPWAEGEGLRWGGGEKLYRTSNAYYTPAKDNEAMIEGHVKNSAIAYTHTEEVVNDDVG